MLLVVQFPLADVRPFVPNSAWRLPVPDWPNPNPYGSSQFVRHFGSATARRGPVVAGWIDEATYCRANHAVAFPALRPIDLGPPDRVVPTCAFRRLFVDATHVVGRVEVGLAVSGPPLRMATDARAVLAVARSVLDLESSVPQTATTSATGPLASQGRRLARLYEFSTTFRARRDTRAPNLVSEGLPLLVVELAENEPLAAIDGVTEVDPAAVGGAIVRFLWLKTSAGLVPVWLVKQGTATVSQLRSVRLSLLRLHANQQALDLVIKQLRRGGIQAVPDDNPDSLSDWLNTSTAAIAADRWGGISQAAIKAAAASSSAVDYANTDEFRSQLEGVRRQVASKVEVYWRERSAVRSIQVINSPGVSIAMTHETYNISNTGVGTVIGKITANDISNSFNTVTNSNASADLKAALKDLHDQVETLLKDAGAIEGAPAPAPAADAGTPAAPAAADAAAAPAATPAAPAGGPSDAGGGTLDAEEVMTYLKALTEQAVASKPAKALIEGAAKGLVDAVKSVATHAGPIIATVSTVLRLVGVPVPF